MKTILAMLSGLVLLFAAPGSTQVIERISVDNQGGQGSAASSVAVSKDAVSNDGRFVVFESLADDLVADDLNGASDVFLRDRLDGTTVRISVNHFDGGDAAGSSQRASISADGRFIVFDSDAGDLVSGDDNGVNDIFLYDTRTGSMELLSVAYDGGDSNATSTRPSISADGRYVCFSSSATNLVSGGANDNVDIYVRDRTLGTTIKVSERTDGSLTESNSWQPVISADGRNVAFVSGDQGLVPDDVDGPQDIFVRNLDTWQIERVSLSTAGNESNERNGVPAVSSDASVVAWWSRADNLVEDDDNGQDDIFVRDRTAGATTRVNLSSAGAQAVGGGSWHVTITEDGRFVVFLSDASNLAGDDVNATGDIFSHDRLSGITRLHSLAMSGSSGNNYSGRPSVSADGRFIVFQSTANDLVDGDDNLAQDVFLSWGPTVILTDGFETSATDRWSRTVGFCDPDGTYASPSLISYSCMFGMFSFSFNSWQFADHGALVITGSNQPLDLVGTPTTCAGGSFSNTLTEPGGCAQTFLLQGVFTDENTWQGTFSVSFEGFVGDACLDCADQIFAITGTRQ